MERADLDDVRDVAALDLDALGHGRSVGLAPVDTALFAVCTHGRRDPCCAERGRPLAAALSQAFPDQTWESTHIGGDRFAGNLIAFPHGFYFGRVDPAPGVAIASGTSTAGSTCRISAVAAAVPSTCRPRSITCERVTTSSAPTTCSSTTSSGWNADTLVTFRTPLGRYRIAVRRTLGPEERLTCHSDSAERPPRFELLEDLATVP